MAQPMNVTVTLDLPDGVEFLGYERVGDGHGIEGAENVRLPFSDPSASRSACIRPDRAVGWKDI